MGNKHIAKMFRLKGFILNCLNNFTEQAFKKHYDSSSQIPFLLIIRRCLCVSNPFTEFPEKEINSIRKIFPKEMNIKLTKKT